MYVDATSPLPVDPFISYCMPTSLYSPLKFDIVILLHQLPLLLCLGGGHPQTLAVHVQPVQSLRLLLQYYEPL